MMSLIWIKGRTVKEEKISPAKKIIGTYVSFAMYNSNEHINFYELGHCI